MPCCCRKRRNSSSDNRHSSLKVLAAQTLKIASINGLGEDNKLETELEDEIRWEEQLPPREVIGRARRKCEEVLHSKNMLLVIIILNVVDCLLVVGELTLDFHQVTDQLLTLEDHTKEFAKKLYNNTNNKDALADLTDIREDDVTILFDRLLSSFIVWNASGSGSGPGSGSGSGSEYTGPNLAADCRPILATYNASVGTATNVLSSLLTFVAEVGQSPPRMKPMDHEHRTHEQMAHKLHYLSISILSFLLLETLLKIGSVGRRFLRKKMEMFDAVVVAISFTLDLVFVQGLTASNMRSFVVILSFLLPWRVLRVLNSLVVALMHQNRFHLKVLYKQKRKITKQLQEATDNIQLLEKQIKILKRLCSERGVQEWEINKALAQTIKPSAQGGLKTLGTLIFKAAESFATLTVPEVNATTPVSTPTPKRGKARGPGGGRNSKAGRKGGGGGGGGSGKTVRLALGGPPGRPDEGTSTAANITTTRTGSPPDRGTTDSCHDHQSPLSDRVSQGTWDSCSAVPGPAGVSRGSAADDDLSASVPRFSDDDEEEATRRAPKKTRRSGAKGAAEDRKRAALDASQEPDAEYSEGGVEEEQEDVLETNPGSAGAFENCVQKEEQYPTVQADPNPPARGQRRGSGGDCGDFPEVSSAPRFYLSSDDSLDADGVTSPDDVLDISCGGQDRVFTRL
ncbi:uncharacterized protein LOC143292228 [Babylonia areolata]|uniref:uncharacterized protein LOC143292228 n=1 Tax=Babylonia areolata TaxID=304850 RepID=UPI003FCF659F